jgi:sirohydrochlorin ferrochelatase
VVEARALSAAVTRPDPYRNFTEHVDAPFFQRIRAVVELARREGALAGVDRLVLADRAGTHTTGVWGIAYADLARAYRLDVARSDDPASRPRCACRATGEAIVVPFKVFAGLLSSQVQAARQEEETRRRCLGELRASCRIVVEDRFEATVLAALGVGRR